MDLPGLRHGGPQGAQEILHDGRAVLLARRQSEACRDVLIEDEQPDRAQGGGRRTDLLDLVEAVPVRLDHRPEAADLPLDPPQPPQQRCALRVGPSEADTTIDECAACHRSAT